MCASFSAQQGLLGFIQAHIFRLCMMIGLERTVDVGWGEMRYVMDLSLVGGFHGNRMHVESTEAEHSKSGIMIISVTLIFSVVIEPGITALKRGNKVLFWKCQPLLGKSLTVGLRFLSLFPAFRLISLRKLHNG